MESLAATAFLDSSFASPGIKFIALKFGCEKESYPFLGTTK
jgi:hypothetical protein